MTELFKPGCTFPNCECTVAGCSAGGISISASTVVPRIEGNRFASVLSAEELDALLAGTEGIEGEWQLATGLIEQLRAATEGSRELDAEIARHFGWFQRDDADDPIYTRRVTLWWRNPEHPDQVYQSPPSVTTDLSAIVALVEKRLPGWRIEIRCDDLASNRWRAVMWNNDISTRESIVGVIGEGPAALACSIALLLALQSEVSNV